MYHIADEKYSQIHKAIIELEEQRDSIMYGIRFKDLDDSNLRALALEAGSKLSALRVLKRISQEYLDSCIG